MDRLTEKPFRINSEYCYEQALDESDCKFYRFVSEVEDFLEEQGFESLDELKKLFDGINLMKNTTQIKDIRIININDFDVDFTPEGYLALKDRWQKLKEFVNEFHSDCVAVYPKTLLNKMQELEDGGDTNVGGKDKVSPASKEDIYKSIAKDLDKRILKDISKVFEKYGIDLDEDRFMQIIKEYQLKV